MVPTAPFRPHIAQSLEVCRVPRSISVRALLRPVPYPVGAAPAGTKPSLPEKVWRDAALPSRGKVPSTRQLLEQHVAPSLAYAQHPGSTEAYAKWTCQFEQAWTSHAQLDSKAARKHCGRCVLPRLRVRPAMAKTLVPTTAQCYAGHTANAWSAIAARTGELGLLLSRARGFLPTAGAHCSLARACWQF